MLSTHNRFYRSMLIYLNSHAICKLTCCAFILAVRYSLSSRIFHHLTTVSFFAFLHSLWHILWTINNRSIFSAPFSSLFLSFFSPFFHLFYICRKCVMCTNSETQKKICDCRTQEQKETFNFCSLIFGNVGLHWFILGTMCKFSVRNKIWNRYKASFPHQTRFYSTQNIYQLEFPIFFLALSDRKIYI